jgi:hypothetical protein
VCVCLCGRQPPLALATKTNRQHQPCPLSVKLLFSSTEDLFPLGAEAAPAAKACETSQLTLTLLRTISEILEYFRDT